MTPEWAHGSGAITPDDAAALGRPKQLALVFLDTLSTARSTTETSGRGVGLSALKESVDQMGGNITIESEPGRGTTFRLSSQRR